jgi:hypothetical protein
MKKFKLSDLNDVTNDINADLHQNIQSQFKKLQIDRMTFGSIPASVESKPRTEPIHGALLSPVC